MRCEQAVVIVTAADRREAEKIASCLLEEKLIACANIIGAVHSLFWWRGKIEESSEHILIMKTRIDLFDKICEKVRALHSYDVPEIIALPITGGDKAYLKWLNSNLK